MSWLAPGIHGYCSIGDADLVAHTPEFAAAAKSERGHEALIHSAKALAMTAVDLLADQDYANQTKEEFNSYKEQGFLNVPGIPPVLRRFQNPSRKPSRQHGVLPEPTGIKPSE